jgi:hypothetical protein
MGLPVLLRGSQGSVVKQLQQALNDSPPQPIRLLNVDGIFGPLSQARVVEVQRYFGLSADGIVGAQTWGAITVTEMTAQQIKHAMHQVLIRHPNPLTAYEADRKFDREWRSLQGQIVPVGAVQVVVIGGIIVLVLIALCIMWLAHIENMKKHNPTLASKWERMVSETLDDARDWMAGHKPLDAVRFVQRHVNRMVSIAAQDLLDLKKKCEQQHPGKMAQCAALGAALVLAINQSLIERLKILMEPGRRGLDPEKVILGIIEVGFPFVWDKAKAFGQCMGCDFLMLL